MRRFTFCLMALTAFFSIASSLKATDNENIQERHASKRPLNRKEASPAKRQKMEPFLTEKRSETPRSIKIGKRKGRDKRFGKKLPEKRPPLTLECYQK